MKEITTDNFSFENFEVQKIAFANYVSFIVSPTGTEQDIESLLDQALDQATSRHYADKYHFDALKVHVVSVVFEHKTHQLVAWRTETRDL